MVTPKSLRGWHPFGKRSARLADRQAAMPVARQGKFGELSGISHRIGKIISKANVNVDIE